MRSIAEYSGSRRGYHDNAYQQAEAHRSADSQCNVHEQLSYFALQEYHRQEDEQGGQCRSQHGPQTSRPPAARPKRRLSIVMVAVDVLQHHHRIVD